MKYSLFIIFILIGISHESLASVSQSISHIDNTIGSATNEVEGVIPSGSNQADQFAENVITEVQKPVENLVYQLKELANGMKFTAKFLWNNVFSPIFDILIQGGQVVFNDHFGLIGHMINQPIEIPNNSLSDKYDQLIAQLKTNIHNLYEQLFSLEHETLKALANGELNFEERIRAFYDKLEALEKEVLHLADTTKYELEIFALTVAGDFTDILNQYKQNIGSTIQSIEQIFKQLTESLIKNILDDIIDVIPNAPNIIERLKNEGLLSFYNN